MVARGRKPTPSHLRLVTGNRNATRHGTAAELREKVDEAAKSFGKLVMPKGMERGAITAWKQFIAPAQWLDGSREPAAIAFCELWAEFRSSPVKFPASKHGQMRAYMSELGLTDERNRGKDGGPKKEKDEFFGD